MSGGGREPKRCRPGHTQTACVGFGKAASRFLPLPLPSTAVPATDGTLPKSVFPWGFLLFFQNGSELPLALSRSATEPAARSCLLHSAALPGPLVPNLTASLICKPPRRFQTQILGTSTVLIGSLQVIHRAGKARDDFEGAESQVSLTGPCT